MLKINISQYSEEIAEKLDWDGEQICRLFLEALTDANFHSLKKELEIIVNREFKKKETSYNYVIIKHNYPELERESTLLPSKYLKSKKYAYISKMIHKDGSESIGFIKYSNDIDKLQKDAECHVSWYNYPQGKAKDIQGNIFNV